MLPKEPAIPPKTHFLVVGLMVTAEYQQCQFLVTKLHAYYPDKYSQPQLRPMMNVDWSEHLLKIRRRYGGDLWGLSAPVAVFMDGSFLGDHDTLTTYVSSTYTIGLGDDFKAMGCAQLVDHFRRQVGLGRDFVTLTLNTKGKPLGTVLVMLYTDLVPHTSRHFLHRCRNDKLTSSRLVRIAKGSWLQFEAPDAPGFRLQSENYTVPHDRRGVVSMCSYRRHAFNTSDFIISLAPTPWMDHKYVAFGQVVQGEEVLALLEGVTTTVLETPVLELRVTESRPFVLDGPAPAELMTKDGGLVEGVGCPEDEVESVLDEDRYRRGLYCNAGDLRDVSDRVLEYLRSLEVTEPAVEEAPEPKMPSTSSSITTIPSLEWTVVRSRGFVGRSVQDIEQVAAEGTREMEGHHHSVF